MGNVVINRAGEIPGWMSTQELGWLFSQAEKMKSIVEIGSWAGRSTYVLAYGCYGTVTAVDTWDAKAMRKWGDAILAEKQFQENLHGFDNIKVMKMTALEAATAFKKKSVDMVFIDADHSYKACLLTIKAWLPKAKKLICGHDFSDNWPGVRFAVREIFGDKFKVCGSIWFVEL